MLISPVLCSSSFILLLSCWLLSFLSGLDIGMILIPALGRKGCNQVAPFASIRVFLVGTHISILSVDPVCACSPRSLAMLKKLRVT